MAKYLVTGVAGFIGRNIAAALLERGHSLAGYQQEVIPCESSEIAVDFAYPGDVENSQSDRRAVPVRPCDLAFKCDLNVVRTKYFGQPVDDGGAVRCLLILRISPSRIWSKRLFWLRR